MNVPASDRLANRQLIIMLTFLFRKTTLFFNECVRVWRSFCFARVNLNRLPKTRAISIQLMTQWIQLQPFLPFCFVLFSAAQLF